MFHLTTQQSKLTHVNVREERHGEETVVAVDLTVAADVPNDFLSYLDPTFKFALYAKVPGQNELIEDNSHVPHLRYGFLPELRVVGAMEKASVTIHGSNPKKDILLEAKVDKLRLMPRDGGTVGILIRVQARPESDIIGRLVGMLGAEIKVSVVPPAAEEGGGEGGGDGAAD